MEDPYLVAIIKLSIRFTFDRENSTQQERRMFEPCQTLGILLPSCEESFSCRFSVES